jgi:tetratricopeptide (TPR) repeat protein
MVADPSPVDWAGAVATGIQGRGAAGAPPARAPSLLLGRRGALLAAAVVALAALAAYANSFGVPFLLDDSAAIATNPSIRSLGRALSPPAGTPVSGRPLLNLSFAANYALGRQQPWGYHALNLLIHASAGLVLLGIVRRTLALPALAGRYGRDGPLLALLAAVLWTVHPLQTEAVTYVSQRAESLMGLLYLLTLYLFVAGEGSASARWWRLASVLACLMGALTKEVIATAPLLVLLYDRAFLAGSLRGALRLRWRYYLAAAASTWLLLALLARGHGSRGVGFGLGVGPWDYALTSCRSLATYLRLAVWPHPLVFDYGMDVARSPADVWPQGLLVAALLAGGAIALWRRPAAGFLFAWFFIVLAPTTSFIPVAAQPIAEHRVYLSLAAAACAAVLVLHRALGRWCALPLAAAAVLLACLTHLRNSDYRSEEAIWTDTLAKRPGNVRAHCAYGFVLSQRPGGLPGAIEQYEAAVRLDPGYVDAHNKLGIALAQTPGRLPDAVAQFEEALRLDPRFVRAHDSLGTALAGIPGRLPDAVSEFEEALRIDPGYAPAHNDLGLALAGQPGRLDEAIAQFEEALRIDPDFSQARNGLGVALSGMPGRLPDAISQYRKALAIDPGYSDARTNLGIALARTPGGLPGAISEYRAVIRADPGFAAAHNALGAALAAASGRAADGIPEYEAALRARPDYPEAHNNLGLALAGQPGSLSEAIGHFEEAIRLNPGYVEARNNLGLALSEAPGRLPEAVSEFEAALRLSPVNAELHNNLGIALAGMPGRLPEAVAHFEEALTIRPDYPDARRNLELARQMLGQSAGGR